MWGHTDVYRVVYSSWSSSLVVKTFVEWDAEPIPLNGRPPSLNSRCCEESYRHVRGVLTRPPKSYLYDHVVMQSAPRPNKHLTEEAFSVSGSRPDVNKRIQPLQVGGGTMIISEKQERTAPFALINNLWRSLRGMLRSFTWTRVVPRLWFVNDTRKLYGRVVVTIRD
jgi:hypothetical protein